MPTPLICDNGMYVNLAVRLARDQPVSYFSSWQNSFPTAREFAPGTGIENVERIDDPVSFMLSGKASVLIVPDLYLASLEKLATACEIPVFGCGDGNRIETDRWYFKTLLNNASLPIAYSVEIDGLNALGDYLKEHDNKYVKVSTFRGDLETRRHDTWVGSEQWFHGLKKRLGVVGENMRFVVEDPIPDALEIGLDTFVIDGQFCAPMVLGIEKKDAGYFGWVVDDVPKAFDPTIAVLAEYFESERYTNFFSLETRIKDGVVYATDATCRVPSPPGGVLMNAVRNLSDVILKRDAPDYGKTKYLYEIILKSDAVADEWLHVDFPQKFKERYAFHNYMVHNGGTWIIPHDSHLVEFGSALGWGADREEAKTMCLEAAEAIKGDDVRFDEHAIDEAEKDAMDSEFAPNL